MNCAAVAWDRPGESYEIQIRAAQDFLGGRSRLTPIMLLKPEDDNGPHNWKHLESSASRLGFFSVIGVTEDELGSSLLDRVVAVMELRKLLRRNELDKPIHIFGALDPLFVPVYFAAGADMLDGLTWLRYAYWHGLAVHHRQGPLLSGQAEQRDDKRSGRFQRPISVNCSGCTHGLCGSKRRTKINVYDDTMLGRSGKGPATSSLDLPFRTSKEDLLMGGGARRRTRSDRSPSDLRAEVQRDLQQARLESDVNGLLTEQLAQINNRDIALINERLDEIVVAALGEKIDEIDRLLYGGSVANTPTSTASATWTSWCVLKQGALDGHTPRGVARRDGARASAGLGHGQVDEIITGCADTVRYKDGDEIQLLPAVERDSRIAISDERNRLVIRPFPKAFEERAARRQQGARRSSRPDDQARQSSCRRIAV